NFIPRINTNSVYTYYPTYAETYVAYNKPAVMPVLFLEENYENEANVGELGTPFVLRHQEYWSFTAGALAGHMYGSYWIDRFDPANATFQTVAGSPFPNSGSHNFTTPGNNSAGDPDWVLLLQAALGSPTPTPTPSPTSTPAPTATPTPTPAATPTPTPISQCTVPNFIGVRLNRAKSIWRSAGFTTTVTTIGPGGHKITSQSLPAGYVGSCTTTTITVTTR